MTTTAEPPAAAAAAKIEEVASPIPRDIYMPGVGGEKVIQISAARMEPELFGVTMRQLAWLSSKPAHPLMERVEIVCDHPIWKETKTGFEMTGRRCEERLTVPKLFSTLTACDSCRADAEARDRMDKCRTHWLRICPPSFRDTDTKHPSFPRPQYERLKTWAGDTSLFFYGPQRTGKSRLAMLMLKRAMLAGKSIGILWPEKLERINPRFEKEEPVETWGRFEVLLLDDALITAKTAQLAGFLKNLIDFIMRHNRRFIITSQVGGDDYIAHIEKGGESSRVDSDTAKALMGRIRECCPAGTNGQVSFANTAPVGQEEAF